MEKYQTKGQFISNLRKERKLTQSQFGEILNVSDKTVSRWENDITIPDTDTLPDIKSYDILAMRWNSNFNIISYTGTQINENAAVEYSDNGGNSNRGTYGAGISMNIRDDTSAMLTMTTLLKGSFASKTSTTIYMTYIHANRDVTLA